MTWKAGAVPTQAAIRDGQPAIARLICSRLQRRIANLDDSGSCQTEISHAIRRTLAGSEDTLQPGPYPRHLLSRFRPGDSQEQKLRWYNFGSCRDCHPLFMFCETCSSTFMFRSVHTSLEGWPCGVRLPSRTVENLLRIQGSRRTNKETKISTSSFSIPVACHAEM